MSKVLAPLPLGEFIEAVSGPKLNNPKHLAPLLALFDRAAAGEEVRATASTHPRVGKTVAEQHAIARFLLMRPSARVGLASYSSEFAGKKSRETRELYKRAGGRLAEDAKSRRDWRTGVGDGGLWAGGIDSGWTGEGFDLLIIDDPIKDRARAESGIERERLWDWFNSVAVPRLEPGGSLIVVHTRWTPDDLIGRLQRDGWEHVRLQAIDAHGRALWPDRYPVAKLEAIKAQIGAYAWASLYQQDPYARGGSLFSGDVQFYESPPGIDRPVRIRIGVDFAYSTRTKSDYSVAVVLAECDGLFYVLEVLRLQVRAPEFKAALETLCAKYYGTVPVAYIGGTERGIIDMMMDQGLRIDARPALADKFQRAQPCAACWNAGRILLPRSAPWLDAFVGEIVSFTGSGDVHDDQVDALASAFDGASAPSLALQQIARYRQLAAAAHASMGGPQWIRSQFGARGFSGGGRGFQDWNALVGTPRAAPAPPAEGPKQALIPGAPGERPTTLPIPAMPRSPFAAPNCGRGWGRGGGWGL